MTRIEGYIRLMIDGDWVAWTGTIIVFLLLSPVLIAWVYFARKFKREEEEKKNKWKKKK
jgi:hypothetical protein